MAQPIANNMSVIQYTRFLEICMYVCYLYVCVFEMSVLNDTHFSIQFECHSIQRLKDNAIGCHSIHSNECHAIHSNECIE